MTKQERLSLYESDELRQSIMIELFDWAGYWTTAGLGDITDPLLKEQTRQAISSILVDINYATKIIIGLIISEDVIKNKTINEITEQDIHSLVVSIMGNKLAWLTGVNEI